MVLTIILWTLTVCLYLGIGYIWAFVFIHKLTDGYWERETPIFRNIVRTKMGVGTAISFTVAWPVTMTVIAMETIVDILFNADFWKKVYRID